MKKTVFLGRELYCCHLKIARHNKFSALSVTYVQVCTQQQKLRFFVCCASCDFSQFFVVLIITEVQSELSIYQNLRKLRKIVCLTIFCYLRFFAVLCHINNHLTRPSCGLNKICENCENSQV